MLILTGLGLGQDFDAPGIEEEPIAAGTASILPVGHIPRSDVLFQEEQQGAIQPVQRAKTAHTLRCGNSLSAVPVTLLTAASFCPIWYSADWAVFVASSWRAIVSLIHRTRRKRRLYAAPEPGRDHGTGALLRRGRCWQRCFCGNADPMVGGGGVMAGTIVGIVALAAIIVVAFVVNIKMNK